MAESTIDLEKRDRGDREKGLVALSSVIAAIFLTSMKLAVGLMTNSLGILSEAAHSALDLVAAAVTLVAVRVSGRPADREHNYGHGKVENLSALFETLLLLLTCVWIIYEAIQRLFFTHETVEVSVWSFVVMSVSIAIDFGRSRALARAAKKYDSQALEADALHFSTDIWSSSVVLVGLFLVLLSKSLQLDWLARADAVAAMGVAGIVTYVSVQLGSRTIAGLLDAVPVGLRDSITRAVRVPGVLDVVKVRVRRSGPEAFADITLSVSRDTTFEEAGNIASAAQTAVHGELPGADVMVHVLPVQATDENVLSTVRVLANRFGLSVHGVRVSDVMGKLTLDLHVEVDSRLTVTEAHAQADSFEVELRRALPRLAGIITHIEPAGEGRVASTSAEEEKVVRQTLQSVANDSDLEFNPHSIEVGNLDGRPSLSFHLGFDADAPITDAHALTEQVEQELRGRLPDLGRVTIHVEPEPEPQEQIE